jgi:hypothetical protein
LKLLGNTALAALVHSIAWVERPQGKTSVLTLQLITPDRQYTHSGAQRLALPRVQIDSWGQSVEEVWAISRAVIPVMEAEAELLAGWRIGPAFLDADRDMDPETVGATKFYRRTQDWFVTTRPVA